MHSPDIILALQPVNSPATPADVQQAWSALADFPQVPVLALTATLRTINRPGLL